MSGRSSDQVDPFRLASQGRGLTLRLPLASLPRLDGVLVSTEGEVVAKLEFHRDEAGRCVLSGHLVAALRLCCQRCLGPMTYDVDHAFTAVVVASDDEAARLQQDYDVCVTDGEGRLDVAAFAEDELLLSLPIVPMHASVVDCPSLAASPVGAVAAPRETRAARPNPFAALAAMKKDEDGN